VMKRKFIDSKNFYNCCSLWVVLFWVGLTSGLIHSDDSLKVCLFWNRFPQKIQIAPIDAPLTVNGKTFHPGDKIDLSTGQKFIAHSIEKFSVGDGKTERMVFGRIFGIVGEHIYAKIPVEKWILLTLLGESPSDTPFEALCACSVVLRSFALSGHHHKNCDVCDRTHCAQIPKPQPIPIKYIDAVKSTENIVLTYDGKIIPATITANCGGHTLSGQSVWGNKCEWSVGILDTFCRPLYWNFSAPLEKLNNILPLPVSQWQFLGDSTIYVGITMARFAFWDTLVQTLGWGTLKSPTFTMKIDNDSVKFSGIGFGHRVGLCQDGAKSMAEKGLSMSQILKYYFPSAKISI